MLAELNRRDLTVLADMMQSGKVKPVIDRTYKLSEVPARPHIWNKDTLEEK